MTETGLISSERIERAILLIRGHKVMLDRDLAVLYEVTTGNLNKAVGRNRDRFPEDFVFQLTREESEKLLIFQNGISNDGRDRRGGHRRLPYAFTEQGVAMLSSALRSKRAALVNVEIMRTFVRLRRFIASHAELAKQVQELERASKRHDVTFEAVFLAMKKLMAPKPVKPLRKVGFKPPTV